MFNFHTAYSIAKKELRSLFNAPTAYIVIIVFLVIWEFLFFRSAFLVGEASLRPLFDLLPWMFLFFIPALTMGSISQEKSDGTLELLLTHPIRREEVLLGKFLAQFLFVVLALAFTFPIAVTFGIFGRLDFGVVAGQYLGALLMGAVFLSLGMCVSSFFQSAISSLLVAVGASFFFMIIGFDMVTTRLPFVLAPVMEQLSVFSHFESMARGVIDLRDVLYFLSALCIFSSIAYLQLLKLHIGNKAELFRKYQFGIALFAGCAVLVNIVGARIPGRIDLTQNHLYTVSPSTKNILANLPDIITVTLYISRELPAQLQPTLRDVRDIIRDYQTFGRGNIAVSTKDPSSAPAIAQEAQSVGVREMQFNMVSNEEFKLKNGYAGIALSYAGKNEVIPYIQDTSDLEYQLTSLIKKLTVKEKPKIAFLSGHGEKNRWNDYSALNTELGKEYDIQDLTFTDKQQPTISKDIKTIVVAGPSQEIPADTQTALKNYVEKDNGSALFLIDTVAVSPQTLSAQANKQNLSDFIKNMTGVIVRQNIAYDLRSNETISFSGGQVRYFLPYAFWVRSNAQKDSQSPILSKIASIVLPWPSSLDADEKSVSEKGWDTQTLFSTTKFGGVQSENYSISPQEQPSMKDAGEQRLALGLMPKKDQQAGKGRMVIIGDSDFLTDQFMQSAPENIGFGMEALAWLSQEDSIAGIRIRQKAQQRLAFDSKTQMAAVKYGNIAGPALFFALYGAFRLFRRSRIQKKVYE
ncbi:Gldg family protein [Candidatus Uhrbacteria bacterium]|nr:Gldg family protein [Candidatus Uhrbacteria bacterium]